VLHTRRILIAWAVPAHQPLRPSLTSDPRQPSAGRDMQHANLIVLLPGHCRALLCRGGLGPKWSALVLSGANLRTVVVKFRLELSGIRFVQCPKVFLRFEPSLNNGGVTALNLHISNEISQLCNSLLAINNNLLDFGQ